MSPGRFLFALRRLRRSGLRSIVVFSLWIAVNLLTPASASLRIVGDSPHASLWQRLYDRMPDVWKTRHVVVVREVSDREMDQRVAEEDNDPAGDDSEDDSVVDGYYRNGHEDEDVAPVIVLRRSMPDEVAAFVFTHEYGHFVWCNKLTKRQRAEYARLWRRRDDADDARL